MTTAVEEGMKTRTMIAYCHNKLDFKRVHETCMAHRLQIVAGTLCSATLAKTADKRLSVDLAWQH